MPFSGVGYTALLVAGWRALHAMSAQPLVRDEYAKHFIAASQDPFLNGALADPGTSLGALTFPRLYGVQTRFFDEFFTSASGAGIRQAVIVAAGLDSRAYRLRWADGTTVFEIDRPEVLAFKVRVLAEHAAALGPGGVVWTWGIANEGLGNGKRGMSPATKPMTR